MNSPYGEPTPVYKAPFIIPEKAPGTVKIASSETATGYMIVNASAFDPASMTLYAEALVPVKDLAAAIADERDPVTLKTLQAADTRKGASAIYAARLTELGA